MLRQKPRVFRMGRDFPTEVLCMIFIRLSGAHTEDRILTERGEVSPDEVVSAGKIGVGKAFSDGAASKGVDDRQDHERRQPGDQRDPQY